MTVPRHVAIIPDGNRRWARARGRSVTEGHRAGIEHAARIVEAGFDAGVEVMTLWWGSPANLQRRDPAEVEGIVEALRWLLDEGISPALQARGLGLQLLGDWPRWAPTLGAAAGLAESRPFSGRGLVVLFAYDGRDEIVDACRRVSDPDVSRLGAAMWTGHLPPVDLVIRTGGEPHLSAGFLLWSIAEAMLAFPEELWPDFGVDAFQRCLADAGSRRRRFGA